MPEAVSQTLTFPQWEESWFGFLPESIFLFSKTANTVSSTIKVCLSRVLFDCQITPTSTHRPHHHHPHQHLLFISFFASVSPTPSGRFRWIFFCISQEKEEFPLYFFAVCTSRELFACLVNGLLPNFSFSFFLCFM